MSNSLYNQMTLIASIAPICLPLQHGTACQAFHRSQACLSALFIIIAQARSISCITMAFKEFVLLDFFYTAV